MSLRNIKDINVVLAGDDYENYARHYSNEYHVIPNINQHGWERDLQDLIYREGIHYIFPAHDDVLLALAERRGLFSAEILCPSTKSCKITRYKSLTYRELDRIVPVPILYSHLNEIEQWPVFVKPDRGQGAIGAKKIDNKEALTLALSEDRSLIISEFLSGDEYTVDCFTSRDNGVLYCQPRRRSRIRAGIAVTSELVKIEEVAEYAQAISTKLNLYGAWFFQIKMSQHGVLKVMEVAPRIAGTMALSRANGVNLPELTIYEHQRKSVTVRPLFQVSCITRSLTNQYKIDIDYEHVYIDYDDTVVVKGKINLQAIAFLYQCINNAKKIHLVTKHQGDIFSSLKKHHLDNVFDSVIHLRVFDEKSEYIAYDNAIFIDDSFSERIDVLNKKNIPVFDVSMLEVLMSE